MSRSDGVPWVRISRHARERIDERIKPLCSDSESARKLVTDAVREAHIERRFSRKVPSWASKQPEAQKFSKGDSYRVVQITTDDGHKFAIIVGIRHLPKKYVIVTVLSKDWHHKTGGKSYHAMSSM